MLDEVGIKADTCLDGQTALHMLELQHAKHEPYNLVLLDWRMPHMDGIEVAKEIHAENGRIVLEMFDKSPIGHYDAILMDVRMPDGNTI